MASMYDMKTSDFRKHVAKEIKELTIFQDPPDYGDLVDSADGLASLLNEAESRNSRGQHLDHEIDALKAAKDAIVENASKAGATKQTLTSFFRWRGDSR